MKTIKELKAMFPDLKIFWHYSEIPKNYKSKSYLVSHKKWKNQNPVAVKGNSLVPESYYFLYETDS